MYKNKRFACPYIKPTRDINTMTVTPEKGSDRVSFAASQEQHISPNSRKLISIEVNPPQAHNLSSGKEAIELVPTSANNLPDDIKVIPCLNYLSPTFQTKIMVENCGDEDYIFLKGDMICCSLTSSYCLLYTSPSPRDS